MKMHLFALLVAPVFVSAANQQDFNNDRPGQNPQHTDSFTDEPNDFRRLQRQHQGYQHHQTPMHDEEQISEQHRSHGDEFQTHQDKLVLQKIRNALQRNEHIDSPDVSISVYEQKVILRGPVSSARDAQEIERIVRNIEEVRDVENRLSAFAEQPQFQTRQKQRNALQQRQQQPQQQYQIQQQQPKPMSQQTFQDRPF